MQVLEKKYELVTFDYLIDNKAWALPLLIWQFFYLIYHLPNAVATVTLFGGYHSYLPTLLSKLFGKPSIVILGGSDCVSFPSIGYGNFNNGLQGAFTRWSLNHASHISTVDESLQKCEYLYTTTDLPWQGYKVFCPKATAPCTTIHFGYDADHFHRVAEKTPNSFLTVGYLNPANYYRKGIDLIFDQAKRRPNCTYTIIGGTEKDLPNGVIKPENVTMLASVSYSELVNHYSAHQFYFQLSMMEGFPSAICEAMLCECIPIGSDVAAIPNIIGDTGFVLKQKDVQLLDALIDQALESQDADLGHEARKRIMQKYPVDEREKLATLVDSEIERFQ